jgi:hypothetical protein
MWSWLLRLWRMIHNATIKYAVPDVDVAAVDIRIVRQLHVHLCLCTSTPIGALVLIILLILIFLVAFFSIELTL